MYMIHEQRNSVMAFIVHHQTPFLLPLLHKLLVKLDEQECLILYIREEVVLANEVKHIWTAESEEEREGFAWLTVGYVSIF